MRFAVRHLTDIRYSGLVRLARFNLRLKPAHWPTQTLIDHHLTVTPRPETMVTDDGPFLVNISRLMLVEPIARLKIESRFTVDVVTPSLPVPGDSPKIAAVRDAAILRRDMSKSAPASYLFPSRIAGREIDIERWASAILPCDLTVVAAGFALMAAIRCEFRYDSDATKFDTPPALAFAQRCGVCQDFAHIMIIAARAHGIPAAYVSGYLRTRPPPGKPRLVGADATHAWVNLWCGDTLGWVGFDPTNNIVVQGDHIFTAMGRDYADVAPVDGVFIGGSGQHMRVAVDVTPLEHGAEA